MNKLHVYTGEGKGKTTASMGLALRGAGHGRRVLVAQFMKKGNSGELAALRQLACVSVMTAPPIKGFTFRLNGEEKAAARAEQTGFAEEVMQKILSWQPETVVLDELGMALALDMADEKTGRALIECALQSGETCVTGRMVPKWLEEMADYLSLILAQKHPYINEKLPARKGVEW